LACAGTGNETPGIDGRASNVEPLSCLQGQRRVAEELSAPGAENAVARSLVQSGEIRLSDLSGVPRGEAAVAAIERYLDKRLDGKIPLTPDGDVDWDTLLPRIQRDPAIRRALNDPALLSRVPVDERAIYVQDLPVGALGAKANRDRGASQGRNPVGPDRPTRNTQGNLAARMGMSLDASTLLMTWDTISKSVGNQNFMGHVLDVWAAKDANGQPRVFSQLEASRLDPEKWATLPVSALSRVEGALRDWTPRFNNKSGLGLEGLVGKPQKRADNDTDAPNAMPDEPVYVIPREAGDHIKWMFHNPRWITQKYDSFLHAWRGGVLALAPRWFLNNFIGNSLFYGLFTLGDFRALRMSHGSRDRLDYSIEGSSYSSQGHYDPSEGMIARSDVGNFNKLSRGYFRVVETGFRINQTFEAAIRRAAYIHAAKRVLRSEGMTPDTKGLGLSRKQREAQLLEAIAEMPDYLKRDALKEMRDWMGNYQNLSPFERETIRRVVPFYSWLRVINTWLFGLPFRSPLRAELLATASQIGREQQGDRSYLPWWEQGRIEFPGGWALRTSGMNPLMSVMEPVNALGQEGAGVWERVSEALRSQGGAITPPLAALVGAMTGTQLFGTRDYTAPVGHGGTVSPFGRESQYYNSVTGQIESKKSPGNLFEDAFQMLPFGSSIRDLASWGQRPYDTSPTTSLLANRLFGLGDENELYQPPQTNGGQGRTKIPGASPVLGLLGAPLYRHDKAQERKADTVRRMKYGQARVQTRRLKARQRLKRLQDSGEFRYE
jgi:hypothetical protein